MSNWQTEKAERNKRSLERLSRRVERADRDQASKKVAVAAALRVGHRRSMGRLTQLSSQTHFSP
jgi:hypothetical protein